MAALTLPEWAPDDPLDWLLNGLLAAVGARSPEEQMAWSLLLTVLAYVSSLISFGATLILAFIFTIMFIIGAIRLFAREVLGVGQ